MKLESFIQLVKKLHHNSLELVGIVIRLGWYSSTLGQIQKGKVIMEIQIHENYKYKRFYLFLLRN